MKKILLKTSLALTLASALPFTALAGKTDGPKGRLMAKYDLNKDGKLDGDEVIALRKDFAAAPEGDLKHFDTDHDGKLSDEEIAAMVPGSGKKSEKPKKSKAAKETPAADSAPAPADSPKENDAAAKPADSSTPPKS